MRWLIFGGNGWIGQQFIQSLNSKFPIDTICVAPTDVRADDELAVEELVRAFAPNRIVCLIGRTHGPGYQTIDYLEQKGKLTENIRDNLFAPLLLASMAFKYNAHLTYLGTACIFTYDQDHPIGIATGKGFQEADRPNFFGSSYSIVKGFTDRLMHVVEPFKDCVLNLRIRMPITADSSRRNFITKITTYEKICSIENSMSVLPELIPIAIDMAANMEVGTVNLTNPGYITHNRILELYRDIIDPEFKWQNFSPEEQAKILAAERSNNCLDTSRLQQYAPQVQPIEQAIIGILHVMKAGKISEQFNHNCEKRTI